jgi:hypothetical protein
VWQILAIVLIHDADGFRDFAMPRLFQAIDGSMAGSGLSLTISQSWQIFHQPRCWTRMALLGGRSIDDLL